MSNITLKKAAKAKNDEFYTQYKDVEAEVKHYNLKDMVVYCNCDNPQHSNFYKYFKDNFHTLQIKHLYATGYNKDGNGYYGEYDGENETIKSLNGNGDFQSEESVEILKKSDVVITNPPFSLFRSYVKQLMNHKKQFLVIGNMNAITYKEIFPYIKNNELWLGCRTLGSDFFFNVPEDYKEELMATKTQGGGWKIIDGEVMGRVASACWFTNIDHKKRNEELDLYRKYDATAFPKYDNYDAIEVSKVCEIPMDYEGVMGVPITFLDKYCPSQFEILGIANNVRWLGDFPCLTKINGNKIYNRILIKRR